jgi:hypothetical protein
MLMCRFATRIAPYKLGALEALQQALWHLGANEPDEPQQNQSRLDTAAWQLPRARCAD